MKLRLATATAQVLGIVIDVNRCSVVASGLDGEICEDRTHRVETLARYQDLIDALVKQARALMARPGVRTLGVGVTVPGLIDHRRGLDILSPNVHVIDGRSPGRDLGERLGIDCIMIQDQHALCMAERYYGRAKGLDDFAILDVSSGVGMGVMSGGRLVRGHSGFAGEIGHITVEPKGRPCGCGNRGCLETVASDTALAGAGLAPAGPPDRHRRADPAGAGGRARSGKRLQGGRRLPGHRPGHRDQCLQSLHACLSTASSSTLMKDCSPACSSRPKTGHSLPRLPTVGSSGHGAANGKGPSRE